MNPIPKIKIAIVERINEFEPERDGFYAQVDTLDYAGREISFRASVKFRDDPYFESQFREIPMLQLMHKLTFAALSVVGGRVSPVGMRAGGHIFINEKNTTEKTRQENNPVG